MTYQANFYYTLHGVLAVLLLVAAACDVWKLIVPNLVSVAVAGLFGASAALLVGQGVDWISHLTAAGAVFGAGLIAYRLSILGAGDVKLLTAVALWAGLAYLLPVFVSVAFVGGLMGLAVIGLRCFVHLLALYIPTNRGVLKVRGIVEQNKLPYALPIAVGSIWVMAQMSPPGWLY